MGVMMERGVEHVGRSIAGPVWSVKCFAIDGELDSALLRSECPILAPGLLEMVASRRLRQWMGRTGALVRESVGGRMPSDRTRSGNL
jgi:hypothetical protein